MNINIYDQTLDEFERLTNGRTVHVAYVDCPLPEHDACPGETSEEVFEELQWELLMAELRRLAP